MSGPEPKEGICGYLVVRVPESNFDEQGRGAFSKSAPCLGGRYYGGIDRMPWFDIEEDFYSGSLPPNLKALHDAIARSNEDFTGVPVCTDFQAVLQVLDYCNQRASRNEIIAVGSPQLCEIKGAIEPPPNSIDWLGYDVVSLGNWSLLREGLFVEPNNFKPWRDRLTPSGLLADPAHASAYAHDYVTVASEGGVEELPETNLGIEPVYVGRVGTG